MIVPDAAVYGSIPVVAGSLVWMGRQFVLDTLDRKGPKGDKGDRGNDAGPIGDQMTVRNYKSFSDFLIAQLNGRYLMATEARERFAQINVKLDRLHDSMNRHLMSDEKNT